MHPVTTHCCVCSQAGSGAQSTFQRVPALSFDGSPFKQWSESVDTILTRGRDLVWIFSGKLHTHDKLIREQMHKLKWEFKPIALMYDTKSMKDAGHIRRQRGMANASATENIYLAWKGSIPKDLAKSRLYVDKGSLTYVDYMSRVPVAQLSELMMVPRIVKEMTLAWSVPGGVSPGEEGGSENSDGSEAAVEDDIDEEAKKSRKYSKRHSGRALMRKISSEETVWFPLDNAPMLMRELVHETNPRWVLHGTPASGVGIVGLLTHGCTVVGCCHDADHAGTLRSLVQQRVAEEFLTVGSALAITGSVRYM